MASDLRTRAVLAPTMLATVGVVYWLDWNDALGLGRGVLSAAVLGLLGFAGVMEYVALLRGGGFAVSRRSLPLFSALLLLSAPFLGWGQLDRELYPPVVATLLLLFPIAVRSLGKDDMRVGLEKQGATLLGFIYVAWPMYFAMGTALRHLPSVLFVVLVCKGGDIGGYCVGRLLGRRKLIPHVSPGKTIEGALGSLGASVALAVALRGPLLAPAVELPLWLALVAGFVLNVTTQTGDLIDSLLFSFCAWFLLLVWRT